MFEVKKAVSGPGEADGRVLEAGALMTDRRRAEGGNGVHQRTWFQTELATIGDAIVATDALARVTFLNPCAERMTGWKQVDAAGKPLQDVFHIVDAQTRNIVESPVVKALREGEMVGLSNHTVLISKDAVEHFIDNSATPIRNASDGTIVGAVMVFHDVTRRREVEQNLEASEIRYRRLFEAAHDGILILSASTFKITDVNPFMLELLNFPATHFIGKELWEIGIFHDKEANQKAMRELSNKGAARFEDLPLQDRNGRSHPVEIVANIYQEDRKPVIQCNIRDISERVQFERQREALLVNEQAARMEAEAANRAKDLFLATLSHEVRTPLNAILGWVSIIRNEKCNAADLKEGMEVIERNCRMQSQLIEDVLDVSRIVSGKMELQVGPCELIDVINAAIDVVRPAAEAKQIGFDISLDPAASRASCDARRIQQVVWNLLANSVKFSPSGRLIRISLTRVRSTAQIEISDEGQGISAEFLPHVFDRFRQAESSTRRKHGGLGLGLSIVKHIVELHAGSVQASSGGAGRGAVFTVNLPVRAVHVMIPAPKSEFRDPPPLELLKLRLDGLNVLAVDDEADARRLLTKVLGEAGANITAVASVSQAMTAIGNACPDVLLSDIAMPDQDGYDLIRRVRNAELSVKVLPAVALTAFAHKDDRLRGLLAGFQVHVAKPIDPHELVAVIATLAGRTNQQTV
jgi:PAS domain S-box-containing protein